MQALHAAVNTLRYTFTHYYTLKNWSGQLLGPRYFQSSLAEPWGLVNATQPSNTWLSISRPTCLVASITDIKATITIYYHYDQLFMKVFLPLIPILHYLCINLIQTSLCAIAPFHYHSLLTSSSSIQCVLYNSQKYRAWPFCSTLACQAPYKFWSV